MNSTIRMFWPVAILMLLLTGSALPGSADDESNPLNAMKSLIGTWQGEMKLQDGSQFTVEIEFGWGIAPKVIHYRAASISDGQLSPWAEGAYWWNPVDQAIEFTELTRMGSISKGRIVWEGGQAELAWKELTSKGTTPYKDTLRMPTSDSWTSYPMSKTSDGWKPVMDEITYHRVK